MAYGPQVPKCERQIALARPRYHVSVFDEIPDWTLDPKDPRAPSREVWARLDDEQRARVVAALPTEFPVDMFPPEGETHDEAGKAARDSLRHHLNQGGDGTGTFIAAGIPVYYPGEPMMAPDLIAVVDVETHKRESWNVSAERDRGLDFALEVLFHGSRKKDLVRNPEWFARLGIPEYYVYDIPRNTLRAWELDAESGTYTPRMPQVGRFPSTALGLDLMIEDGMLRFYQGRARIPTIPEFLEHLERLVSMQMTRAEEEGRRAEEEARRAEEEARRAEEEGRRAETLEAENVALRAELARLRGQLNDEV